MASVMKKKFLQEMKKKARRGNWKRQRSSLWVQVGAVWRHGLLRTRCSTGKSEALAAFSKRKVMNLSNKHRDKVRKDMMRFGKGKSSNEPHLSDHRAEA